MMITKTHFRTVLTTALILTVMVAPVAAQADPVAAVEDWMSTFETLLRAIAGGAAVCGVLMLAILNMGSVFPPIGDWKKENPKLAGDVTKGIMMMIFVGVGGLTALISLA